MPKSQRKKWRGTFLTMIHLVTIGKWITFSAVFFLFCASPFAYALNPCSGKGTVVFFVNGIFDNLRLADSNLKEFQKSTQPTLSEIKNLKYRLAWVEDSWRPLQLAEAMVQRGV